MSWGLSGEVDFLVIVLGRKACRRYRYRWPAVFEIDNDDLQEEKTSLVVAASASHAILKMVEAWPVSVASLQLLYSVLQRLTAPYSGGKRALRQILILSRVHTLDKIRSGSGTWQAPTFRHFAPPTIGVFAGRGGASLFFFLF